MGKFEKGILGHFDGKVGTVVGSTWKGVNYMKSKSKKSKKPPTMGQVKQQARFGLMVKFINALGQLLKNSFSDATGQMTGVNIAMSYNLKNAITGDYPSYAIDFNQVLVAKGSLHNVFNPIVSQGGNGGIKFGWTKNAGANSKADDISVLVAYCPEMQQGVFADSNTRETETGLLDAVIFTGKVVHTYILFFSADRSLVSSSLYCGELTVS